MKFTDFEQPLFLAALLGAMLAQWKLAASCRIFARPIGSQLLNQSFGSNKLVALLIGSAVLLGLAPSRASAQRAPVNLGGAGNFTILAKTGITDVPPSPIVGNIGASPITGAAIHVTCSEVTGTISSVDAAGPAPCSLIAPAALGQAVLDMQTAYTDAAGRTIPDFTELAAGNISGKTLVPGLYKWSTGVSIDNTGVTLSGGPNSVWIFQIAGDLNLANGANVNLAGGAQASNVFWQVGGPTGAVLGTTSSFFGTILSAKQVIVNTGAHIVGRALAMTQVTLQSTTATSPGPLVNGVPPLVAPTVSSTLPVNLATSVPSGSILTATFSEPMDATSISGLTFSVKNGPTPVLGSVTYSGSTATFTPSANLPTGSMLTATITTGAKDPAGVALPTNYVWTFTTSSTPDVTAPTVISTMPASGATSVPINSTLSATFSKAVNPSTVSTTSFTLQQGATSVPGTVSLAGATANFIPGSSLLPNASYTATINTSVKDLAGNALAAAYSWSFTTSATPISTPPVVTSTTPLDSATLVTLTSDLVANFSRAMDPLTLTPGTFLLKQGATSIPGTVTNSGASSTFRPAANLAPNTPYSATITTAAADLAGNKLAANYSWSFTTGTSTGQTPICLANFAVLAGSSILSSAASAVTGDIGVSPGASIVGFPPGTLSGTIHSGDATAAQAMADFAAGYGDAVSRSVGPVSLSGNIGGQTLTAGLYKSTSSIDISSGDLTLDAKGDANAVFIFQMATTLSIAAGRQVTLTGSAQAFNVFWQVGTSATLGANSLLVGGVLADQSITLGTGATVNGRLSARTGTITLQADTITSPPASIASGGIVNAATDARTVAAGSIASVFGNNLSSSLMMSGTYPLQTSLGGSSFQIGNQNAPLFMNSCGQANLQVPWEAAGQTQDSIVALVGGLVSTRQPVTLATFAPGIFSINMVGSGQGAVEIVPTSLLAMPKSALGRPVKRGEYIALFATGLGPVTHQPATGAPAPSDPLSMTTTLPVVTVGGAPAVVSFSGLAPGFAGLYQVNVLVPDAALTGDSVNLTLTIGGVPSNTVTIAVQ